MGDVELDSKNYEKEQLNDDLNYLLNGEIGNNANELDSNPEPHLKNTKQKNKSKGVDNQISNGLEHITFSKKERTRIKNLVTEHDIIQDIDEIVFSSDEEVLVGVNEDLKAKGKSKTSKKNKPAKTKEHKKSTELESPPSPTLDNVHSSSDEGKKKSKHVEVDKQKSKKDLKQKSQKDLKSKESMKELKSKKNDLNLKNKNLKPGKPKKQKNPIDQKLKQFNLESSGEEKTASDSDRVNDKKVSKKSKKKKSQSEQVTDDENKTDAAQEKKPNSKKKKSKQEESQNPPLDLSQPDNDQNKENLDNEMQSKNKSESPLNEVVVSSSSKETTPEAPFNIKLRSVKSTHSNKKYKERLPQIQPIETIMGLSNEQIYGLSPNDIKLKSIITQADKALRVIINFAMENEDMFKDEEVKTIFIDLCINIALYESRGLNKTVKRYPNVIELFCKFDALTLSFNNTPITKSDRQIHQNNFDYSVLLNIGNIIIWVNSINNQLAYVPKKLVRQSFGGYHLWDQLFKEDSINMKRWKHIIKFRELFPFQINQFIVIMKFMHVGI